MSASSQGDIHFRRHAPYIGVGWGRAPLNDQAGWHLQGDIGVMFMGRPRTRLQSSGCDLGSSFIGTLACNELQRAVPEETYRLEKEIEDYRIHPALRIGIGYRF